MSQQLRRSIFQGGRERDYTLDEVKRMSRHAFGEQGLLLPRENGYSVGRFLDGLGQSPRVRTENGVMRELRWAERPHVLLGWGPTWTAAFFMAKVRFGCDFG